MCPFIVTDLLSFMYPTRKTTSGQKGVWVYEIGSSPFFTAITPGIVSGLPEEGEDATELPVTMLPRQPDEHEVVFTTYEPQGVPEEWEFPTETPTETPTEYQPNYPEAETITPGYAKPETEEPDYGEPDQFETEYPESETVTPAYTYPERAQPTYLDPSEPRYLDQTETTYPVSEPSQPIYTIPETIEPRYSPIEPRYPDPNPVEPRYTNPEPVQPVPPYSQPHQPQIVVVDEDEDLDVNGKSQKLKTFGA